MYPGVAKWSTDGTKIYIMDVGRFSDLFYNWNLSSSSDFAYIKKQLNTYGFEVETILENEQGLSYLVCSNPNFIKDKPVLLRNIKSSRKLFIDEKEEEDD